MSTISLRLPESIHRRLADLADREGVSINQLIASAAAEKLAALMTEEYLAERGARASRSRFRDALAKVPDVAPGPHDALPARPSERSHPRSSSRRLKRADSASRASRKASRPARDA
jgi:hypothetical protein